MEQIPFFTEESTRSVFRTRETRADEDYQGGVDEMYQSFDSESQIVLDVQCPSSQFGTSFMDNTITTPVLPDFLLSRESSKRFDFAGNENPESRVDGVHT